MPETRPIAPHDLPEPLDAALLELLREDRARCVCGSPILAEPPRRLPGERRFVRCLRSAQIIGAWRDLPEYGAAHLRGRAGPPVIL